jgi:L-malate glycosyltransferase
LRILQVSSAESIGGGERHLADLANALTDRGHDVYCALRPGSPLISELHRVPQKNISILPLRNALDPVSARKLERFVRENKIQIVHAHMARDYPVASYAARRNQAKLIITRHVLFPLTRLHALTLSNVASVIAVSEAVARSLRAQKLFPEERIAVAPNGIDVVRFANARNDFDHQEFCKQINVPQDHLLIGTVGELKPLKGHEDFLRAASIVVRHFPNTRFLIAGVDYTRIGEHRALLERLANELGLTNCVQFLDWLQDLPSFYCALDVFVSASHTESFGLAIAEAMASTTPVVATMTEGAQEIIENGESGLLAAIGNFEALADEIVTLLKDDAKAQRIATRGYERIRARFSLRRMVDETERIYLAALNERIPSA